MDNEKQTNSSEIVDLTGEVLIRCSDGSIVKGRAIKDNLVDNDVTYVVAYEIEGETRRRSFRKGDLEAMQADIAKQLETEVEPRRVQLEPRLAGQSVNAAPTDQPNETDMQRIKERLEGSNGSQIKSEAVEAEEDSDR